MNEGKANRTGAGMLWGMMIGAAFGMTMFLATGNPVFFGLTGAGVALGLSVGASLERDDEGDNGDCAS